MNPPIPNEPQIAKVRLFIALPVPLEVKEAIRDAQNELRRSLSEGCATWTRPEQWHLTLKFLGNVDEAAVAALIRAIGAACEQFTPLKLHAERIESFPGWRRPRVVWVGVRDKSAGLAELASAIEDAAARFTSEEREGQFTGHITIARIKFLKRPQTELLAKVARGMAERAFGAWTADAVELMRSELGAGGAKHTCLARLPLLKIT